MFLEKPNIKEKSANSIEFGDSPSRTSPTNLNVFRRATLKRSHSAGSSLDNGTNSSDPWGWFDDFENHANNNLNDGMLVNVTMPVKTLSLPIPVSNPPSYILESSKDTQLLWYETAGQRPQQPKHEREYYEKLWERNFETSEVKYESNSPDNIDSISLMDENMRVDTDIVSGNIVERGTGPFSMSVSKSFQNHDISCVTLQMPSFRVIRCADGREYAEFLVVMTFSHMQALSLGIWRRHSDFAGLVHKVGYIFCFCKCLIIISNR